MAFPDITLTSLETITAFDIASGDFLFMLDELQSASLQQSEETVDITGKQGRRLNSLKRNKAVTVSGTNGLVSGGMLAVQSGSDEGFVHTSEALVRWTDYIVAGNGGALATTYEAEGETGKEIAGLYAKESNGTLGTKYTQVASNPTGAQFTYNPSTKAFTFGSGAAPSEGDEFVAFYNREIEADVLENDSGKYARKCALYIDAFGEDKCANIYRVQIYIPQADFNGNFTFDMGDNQTVHSFEANALAGACGSSGLYWTFTVYGETDESEGG